jgi:hypothetical protein
MADRFWVGGAGNWSSTTKWSATSGGSSGASVPTSADDAIFDANSGGKFIATVDTAQSVNSLTITPSSGAGVLQIALTAPLTTGNLTTTGTAGNNRIWFRSTTYGISIDFIVNGTVSISDCDFRGLYVRGTAAPISGTRIGNRGECRGITFDAPKTVYWNLASGGNWVGNAWAPSSGGTVNTDNFPLPQDTAVIGNTGLNTSATISFDGSIPWKSSIDMSTRTNAMTISSVNNTIVYGNWTNGSGTTISGTSALTFSGGTTQTITSAGKTFPSAITIDTYGGTVQLADALNLSNALTVTNGTFDTKNYNVTLASGFNTVNSNVRTIKLGSSTVSASTFNASTFTNLTLDAGTSQVFITSSGNFTPPLNSTFYNVTISGTTQITINAGFTCNNLTFAAPSGTGVLPATISFNASIIVNGTFTCAGASAIRRIFVCSSIISRQVTMTVNAISADDCDFRDINLAGTASGASPTRAGDCGGNTGITFPAPKTVYWNLGGGIQRPWTSTAWATSSGGTPDINNFPLAQDTAVFDDAGAMPTSSQSVAVSFAFNLGSLDASARTTTGFLLLSSGPVIYNNFTFGTGITSGGSSPGVVFSGRGTQTITSNGVPFNTDLRIDHPLANVQLADALSNSSSRTLAFSAGTFDAVTYNVTTGIVQNLAGANTLRMGSGTWTITGVGTIWAFATPPTLIASTSTIVLSDTSASVRTFQGGGRYYNKLTVGGATGTSTLTITGNNTFGELASTKTVAHTIAFGTAVQTFGKWSVTGTAGNVVTITGTSTTNVIAGPAVTGVDYLVMGTWGISTTSPGEFYAGANSTGTAAAPVFRTAAPAPRTLYWVGGTGNWSSTTKWDTTSGGGGGAAIPTSLDAVNFDSLSNATAYTATIDAGVTLARCASFTMAGPLVGNVTFAGSVGIAFHGNVSFAATGITRTYTGAMQWAGNGSYTFTTNGLATGGNNCTVIGIGATWTLGSGFSIQFLTVTNGIFNTSTNNYSVSAAGLGVSGSNPKSVFLNNSTISITGGGNGALTTSPITNLTWDAGTSQINMTATVSNVGINSAGVAFNNVSFTAASTNNISITGANTFNTLSFAGRTTVGIIPVTFNANQTISTLTLNAGTASAFRTFLASNTIGTTRTLTVGTLTAGAADIDFRDITIAGAAAPISGTRFGDAKGNSGITFDAAKTVYYRSASTSNWGFAGSGVWSATSGGAFDATQFPLAQDTAVFPISPTPYPSSGNTVQVNAAYNIGTIDMSLRTTNTMTLALSADPFVYGDWINGTGITTSGNRIISFSGRTTQTITSAGIVFAPQVSINSPGGSVTLQDALTVSAGTTPALQLANGTFNANNYNVSCSGVNSTFTSVNSNVRTLAMGSGTWLIAGSGNSAWSTNTATNLTITGTATINMASASAKGFSGGGANYSGITLNQGGAGTLTIFGNNTFKDITNTYSATGATSILLQNTTQTLTDPWTATGEAGRVLTVSGSSAASPGTLIFSGGGQAANVDYLAINNVRAYNLTDTWYAGANSTNGGSLGWVYASGVIAAVYLGNFFAFF